MQILTRKESRDFRVITLILCFDVISWHYKKMAPKFDLQFYWFFSPLYSIYTIKMSPNFNAPELLSTLGIMAWKSP